MTKRHELTEAQRIVLGNPGIPIAAAGLATVAIATQAGRDLVNKVKDGVVDAWERSKQRFGNASERLVDWRDSKREQDSPGSSSSPPTSSESSSAVPPPPSSGVNSEFAWMTGLSVDDLRRQEAGARQRMTFTTGTEREYWRRYAEAAASLTADDTSTTIISGDSTYGVRGAVAQPFSPASTPSAIPETTPPSPPEPASTQDPLPEPGPPPTWSTPPVDTADLVDRTHQLLDAVQREVVNAPTPAGAMAAKVLKQWNPLAVSLEIIWASAKFGTGFGSELVGETREQRDKRVAAIEDARQISLALSRGDFEKAMRIKRQAVEEGRSPTGIRWSDFNVRQVISDFGKGYPT